MEETGSDVMSDQKKGKLWEDAPRFTFFKSFYDGLRDLPAEVVKDVIIGICVHVFEGHEPELDGVAKAIYMFMLPNVDASVERMKRGSRNGALGGAPKGNTNALKTTQEQPKNNPNTTESEAKTNKVGSRKLEVGSRKLEKEVGINNNTPLTPQRGKTSTSSIIDESDLSERVKEKTKEWIEYKKQQFRFDYKEQGMRNLLKEIEKNCGELGDDKAIEVMETSMGRGYKGIIWDLAKKIAPKYSSDPFTSFIGGQG